LTGRGERAKSRPVIGRPPVGSDILRVALVLFGLCVGSFLNVVVHRLPLGRSIVTPRSACPSCRAPISWYDNLPILSYLLLAGRCRRCRAGISLRYPLVEALTALLFLAAGTVDSPPAGVLLARLAVVSALVAVSFIDLDHLIVPDSISIPLMVLGPIAAFAVPELLAGAWLAGPGAPPDRGGAVLASAFGALVGGVGLNLVRWGGSALFRRAAERQGGEAMGFGDVKLLAGIGAWTGGQGALLAFVLGSALGALFGLAHIGRLACVARARRSRRASAPGHGAFAAARRFGSAIPFAPFLAAGGVAALLLRGRVVGWFDFWIRNV
jgi:leader peptidase (prepilin peptidase) / N-methyltransferase